MLKKKKETNNHNNNETKKKSIVFLNKQTSPLMTHVHPEFASCRPVTVLEK